MSKWYIICTRKGWEKKVEQVLFEKGFESYCPQVKVKRQWSDRMKVVSAPVFGSHIFVKITEEQRPAVRLTPGVRNFVYANGKAATVKKKEMERLRQLLAGGAVRVVHLNGAGEENGDVQAGKNGSPGALRLKATRILIGEKSYEVRAETATPDFISVPTAIQTQ